MTDTIASIAKDAFDNALQDAINTATLTSTALSAYNATTGAYTETETTYTGRAVLMTERAVMDSFPDYVVGPGVKGFALEGFTVTPTENWKLTIGSTDYRIGAVLDVALAGTFFLVTAT